MSAGKTYTDEYIDKAFYVWYESNRKSTKYVIEHLPDNEDGKRPGNLTVENWKKEYGWRERADALDAEMSRKMDEEVINRRMDMFKKHEALGDTLIEKGKAFLDEKGITSDQAAIRAIDLGISTQRVSVGMAEAYLKISKMTNEQITANLAKLLGSPENKEEIIDAEEIDDISDTESE